MKLAKLSLVVGVLGCLALMASPADAARLYFTAGTGAGVQPEYTSQTNPVINLTVGQTTSIVIWAELLQSTTANPDFDPQDPEGTGPEFWWEQFAGIGLDIARSNSNIKLDTDTLGPASNTTPDFIVQGGNGTGRWGSVGKGTYGGGFITDNANFVKSGGSPFGQPGQTAVTGGGGYVAAANGAKLVQINVEAVAPGTTTFKLGVGSALFGFQNQAPGYPIFFGWGDSSVNSISPGAQSTLADITFNITAVPEPSTLALFGLGLVGLVALRKRS